LYSTTKRVERRKCEEEEVLGTEWNGREKGRNWRRAGNSLRKKKRMNDEGKEDEEEEQQQLHILPFLMPALLMSRLAWKLERERMSSRTPPWWAVAEREGGGERVG
jgi:hypothetical protein